MFLLHVKYYTQKSGFVKGQEERKFDIYFKPGNVPTGKIREFRQASRSNCHIPNGSRSKRTAAIGKQVCRYRDELDFSILPACLTLNSRSVSSKN